MVALGLDAKGDILWNYPLPNGIHNQPVELVTPGRFPTANGDVQGVWLVAGADSSIHILSVDGKLIDKFNYGEELTGMATAMIDDKPTLLVSTAKGVTAWSIQPPE